MRLLNVPIEIHYYYPYKFAKVPTARLRSYFQTAGIELDFSHGETFYQNPFNQNDDGQEISKKYRQSRAKPPSASLPWPALMWVSGNHPDHPNILGELLDSNNRGEIAVYASNAYDSEDLFFDVCVHEIGHLLNLTHNHANSHIGTAMQQQKKRSKFKSRSKSWTKSIQIADQRDQQNMEQFFDLGRNNPFGYPLSNNSMDHLRREQDIKKVYPWGSRFQASETEDKTIDHLGLELSISPEFDFHHVGGAFSFEIEINNPSVKNRYIPTIIGPKFGNIKLTITRPDGFRYDHQSRTLACTFGKQLLKSGHSYTRAFSFIDGPGGAIFPEGGLYKIQIEIPKLSIRSPTLEIQVSDAPNALLSDNEFRKRISQDHLLDEKNCLALLSLLKQDEIPADTTAVLSYISLSSGLVPKTTTNELLNKCLGASAPLRVRQKMALTLFRLRVEHEKLNSLIYRKAKQELLAQFSNRPNDKTIINGLESVKKLKQGSAGRK